MPSASIGWQISFSYLWKHIKLPLSPELYCALYCFAGIFFLLRFLYEKKFPVHVIAKAMSVSLACLVLVNMVLALVATGKAAPNDTQVAVLSSSAAVTATPSAASSPSASPTEAKPTPDPTPEPFGLPNVYFFILDEYSSFDILSKYYGYDNAVFDDFLGMEGFQVVRESYSTDTQTEHSICDLLNLDYISRHLSKSECYDAIEHSEMFSVFSDMGYSQFQYSTSDDHFEGIVSLTSTSGKEAYEAIVTGDADGAETGSNTSPFNTLSELLRNQTPRC